MKRPKDDSVTFRLRKSFKDRIAFIAELDDRSLSQTVGKLITRGLAEAENAYKGEGSIWAIIEDLREKDNDVQIVKAAGATPKKSGEKRKPIAK